MKISFCPTIAGPVRRHQVQRRTSSGKGNIKGQVYIIERFHLAFYNLTKPLTRQDCSHTRCNTLYEDLVRRSPPELPQQRKSSNHDAAQKPRTSMKEKPVICFWPPMKTRQYILLVVMYKSLFVCGCQWWFVPPLGQYKKKILQYIPMLMQTKYLELSGP